MAFYFRRPHPPDGEPGQRHTSFNPHGRIVQGRIARVSVHTATLDGHHRRLLGVSMAHTTAGYSQKELQRTPSVGPAMAWRKPSKHRRISLKCLPTLWKHLIANTHCECRGLTHERAGLNLDFTILTGQLSRRPCRNLGKAYQNLLFHAIHAGLHLLYSLQLRGTVCRTALAQLKRSRAAGLPVASRMLAPHHPPPGPPDNAPPPRRVALDRPRRHAPAGTSTCNDKPPPRPGLPFQS